MLNELKGFCEHLDLVPYYADSNGLFFKCTIYDKFFTLVRNKKQVRITTFDDTIFNSFCAVLQPKFKSLLTIRRNVELLGDTRPYNLIEFCCAKETKIKTILGLFESVYLDILKEKDEKVGL